MLTKNENNILSLLFELAKKTDKVSNARIACAIVIDREVISIGYNQKKSHPFQAKFTRHPDAICIHAENDAIVKALKKVHVDKLKRASMFVVRAKHTSPGSKLKFGLAKPCEGCQSAIAAYDIKEVIYSTDEGKFECL